MELLKPKEAAEKMNVSLATVYRMVADNEIISTKVRGGIRISKEEIGRYLEKNSSEKRGDFYTPRTPNRGEV
jgi:excisionase family DNA binding protein